MSNVTNIRLRVLPRFPARILGANGFTVVRDGTDLVVQPDYGQLAVVPAVPDMNESFFQTWTRNLDTYSIIPFQSLVDNIGDVIIGPNLSSIGALETSTDTAMYWTGEGEAGLYTVTDFVRTISASTDAEGFRDGLGLADVAATGAYADLSGTPTLGTAAAEDAAAFATATQGATADSAMQPTEYDPQAIGGDAFAFTNMTGTVTEPQVGDAAIIRRTLADDAVGVTKIDDGLRNRLPRPSDLFRLDGQTYCRFFCKGSGDNPMGRAVGMAIDEVGRNLFMFFVTNGRIHRFDLDGPAAARSLDYMDCGSILGHQTLGLEYVAAGGIRLWAPALTEGTVLRMNYIAGGSPTVEEYIVHENEGGINYTSLTVSYDGRYLICTGSDGDSRPVKVFDLPALVAGGPGDYRSAALHTWEIPAYLRETEQALQAIASDGSVLYMFSGRGDMLTYDNKRGVCDIQTGELLSVIDSEVGVADAAGVDGNNVNEPEGADMMTGEDGQPALVTFNLAGGADARNSFRVYISGKRPSSASVAAAATARIVSALTTKPATARQYLMESVIRELVKADVWDKMSWLHLANFSDAASRLNWIAPRWGALVDDGASGTIGFTVDRGFNVATAGKRMIFNVGPRNGPNLEYLSAHYGGVLLGNAASSTILGLADGGTQVLVQPRSSGGNFASRHNCTATSSQANADSNGHYIVNRVIAAEYTKWRNGVLFATSADAANTFSTNDNMAYITGTPSTVQLVCGHGGLGLDNTRRQALEAAISRYRTEIGAV